MYKICIVTTMWTSIHNWISPFFNEFKANNIDVTIVCNMDKGYEDVLHNKYPYVHIHAIPFPRGIALADSLKSIYQLIKLFKREKYDLVQFSTPNASLYTAIASCLCRVPIRIYCQWGIVYFSMSGIKRVVFSLIERIVCFLATEVQPDSKGNLEFCRANHFYNRLKSNVIWNGSAKGLDLCKFEIDNKELYKQQIKEKYELKDEPIIGFVGRLGRDKGCNELIRAYIILKNKYPNLKLLFIGPIEKEDTIDPDLLRYFYDCRDIIKTGRVENVEEYLSAMDIFILPTYREGFGMSVIEASAMQVPVIVTEYPGPSSAIIKNITGYAIPIKSIDAIVKYTDYLLSNPIIAQEMGIQGRHFVCEAFDQKVFKEKYIENRLYLLRKLRKDC